MSETTYSQRYNPSDTSTAGTFVFDAVAGHGDVAVSKLGYGAIGSLTYVDGSNPLPVTLSGNVTVVGTGTFVTQAAQSGTWTVQPGNTANTTPWLVRLSDGTNSGTMKTLGTQITSSDVGDVSQVVIHGLSTGGGGTYVDVKVNPSGTLTVDASGTAVPVTDNSGSLTVDNGGTFAVQAAQSGTWNVGTVTAVTTVSTVSTITNVVHVDDNSGSLTVDGTVTATLSSSTNAGATAKTADYDTGAGTDTVTMFGIALPASGGAVAGGTSTNPIQVSLANTGANSTAVKVDGSAVTQPVSYATTGSGTATGALRVELANNGTGTLSTVTTVTTCSTVTTLTGGGVAHDSVDSGNPVKVGARAALTLSDDTMVANADRTDNVSDADGCLLVRGQFPLGDLTSERVTDTGGTSTAFSNFTNTANVRNYITAISLFNSSATAGYVDFRDGTAGSVLYTVAIPAGGGAVISSNLPLFRTSTNTALAYDVSGALTTVYISVSGFRSKV